MRMLTCPYCGSSYDISSSCDCVCPHKRDKQVNVCDECVAEALKGIKPQKELWLGSGPRSKTGPKLTENEANNINKLLKEAQ